jgi:hypothetical protein
MSQPIGVLNGIVGTTPVRANKFLKLQGGTNFAVENDAADTAFAYSLADVAIGGPIALIRKSLVYVTSKVNETWNVGDPCMLGSDGQTVEPGSTHQIGVCGEYKVIGATGGQILIELNLS